MNLRREIQICNQVGGSCVKTAVETTRKALGYILRSPIKAGGVSNQEFAGIVGDCFPRHKIIAYLHDDNKGWIKQKNVTYGGSNYKYEADIPCIWLFVYTDEEAEDAAHMVIGYPSAYGGMQIISAYKILI